MVCGVCVGIAKNCQLLIAATYRSTVTSPEIELPAFNTPTLAVAEAVESNVMLLPVFILPLLPNVKLPEIFSVSPAADPTERVLALLTTKLCTVLFLKVLPYIFCPDDDVPLNSIVPALASNTPELVTVPAIWNKPVPFTVNEALDLI